MRTDRSRGFFIFVLVLLAGGAIALPGSAGAAAGHRHHSLARFAPPRGAAKSPITLSHSRATGAIYLRGSRPARLIKADCSSACAGPLFYWGGPVMSKPKVYAIYWHPSSTTLQGGKPVAFPPAYETTIDKFMENVQLASSPLENAFSVDLLYGDEAVAGEYGWTYSGAFEDTEPLPARSLTECPDATPTEEVEEEEGKFGLPPVGEPCVTDGQLRTQIEGVLKEHSLPTGLGTLYFIMTPETINSCAGGTGKEAECTTNSYCAYHSDISSPEIIYANMPYADKLGCETPDQPNHNAADDEIDVISHEGNEAITDPLGGEEEAAERRLLGWLAYSGNEVADLCTYPFFEAGIDIDEELDAYGPLLGGTPRYSEVGGKIVRAASPGTAFNQEINGDPYLLQREWSDAAKGCVAHAPRPSSSLTVYSSPAVAGRSVSFDGGGSSAGAGELVAYEWNFGDGVQASGSTLAQTQHTYASVGTYTVTLRVTNDSGASATSSQRVMVNAVSPSEVTTTTTSVTPSVTTTASATTTRTVSVPIEAEISRYSASQLAKLLGLPASGAKLSGLPTIALGHASCPPACGIEAKIFAHPHPARPRRPSRAVLIGHLKETLANKGTGTIALALTGKGKTLLRKTKQGLPVQLVVSVEERSGASWTIERRLTLTSGGRTARRRPHTARSFIQPV